MASRDQRAFGCVPAIGESFEEEREALLLGFLLDRTIGSWQTQQGQCRVVDLHRARHSFGLGLVANDGVVQRAVRLHIRHGGTGSLGNTGKRADLVHDRVGELVGLHVDEPATEAGDVGVADVSPDRDVVLDRHLAGATHDRGITGVEPAGDVGRGDDLHQLTVGPARPRAVALADIAVEIDGLAHLA